MGLAGALELGAMRRPDSVSKLAGYRNLVRRCLTLVPRCTIDPGKVLEALAVDKKRVSDQVRFVLLDRPGKPFIDERPGKTMIRKAIDRMLSLYGKAKERHG